MKRVSEQDRLGFLQGGLTWHTHIYVLQSALSDSRLNTANQSHDRINLLQGKEAQIKRDLIVAAPGSVQAQSVLADQGFQRFLDIHMHVLALRVEDKCSLTGLRL